MDVLQRVLGLVSVLRILTCFLKVGILGEVLGEDLNRIFISFMLIHQNDIYSPDYPSLGVVGSN